MRGKDHPKLVAARDEVQSKGDPYTGLSLVSYARLTLQQRTRDGGGVMIMRTVMGDRATFSHLRKLGGTKAVSLLP